MSEYLFSYGTLQKQQVQIDLFGRILQGSVDSLKGYKSVSIEIKDELFLSKGEDKNQLTLISTNDKNDGIEGTVFEVTGEELAHADKYEPANFKRIQVTLESGKKAWLYLADKTS